MVYLEVIAAFQGVYLAGSFWNVSGSLEEFWRVSEGLPVLCVSGYFPGDSRSLRVFQSPKRVQNAPGVSGGSQGFQQAPGVSGAFLGSLRGVLEGFRGFQTGSRRSQRTFADLMDITVDLRGVLGSHELQEASWGFKGYLEISGVFQESQVHSRGSQGCFRRFQWVSKWHIEDSGRLRGVLGGLRGVSGGPMGFPRGLRGG